MHRPWGSSRRSSSSLRGRRPEANSPTPSTAPTRRFCQRCSITPLLAYHPHVAALRSTASRIWPRRLESLRPGEKSCPNVCCLLCKEQENCLSIACSDFSGVYKADVCAAQETEQFTHQGQLCQASSQYRLGSDGRRGRCHAARRRRALTEPRAARTTNTESGSLRRTWHEIRHAPFSILHDTGT
jgi:hypothetical protein